MYQFQPGDFVVHVSHGIGIYKDIKQIELNNRLQDFIVVDYADGASLYVSINQLDLVHKYVGGGGSKPRLDRLGGRSSWQKRKSRVKKEVESIARELMELYADREKIDGYAFPPDNDWQQKFEAMFPHDETSDQLKAIAELKEDMEKPRPMDRLISGDVGYGKTEVVLRATFKATVDGKQVAILVPTTVLALQHFERFCERFDPFPIEVEMLSRLRSDLEREKIIRRVQEGAIDLLIGTHSLLSPEVKFKELGLLVIDEEHRFGVKQKEKIKQLKRNVDVLTLTATPIPRTLHMSMVGLRDVSRITTPPKARLPIETVVTEYNPEIAQEAICREIDRNGQVFFVHNRIETIESVAKSLQKSIPSARIAVAHGQMPPQMLENIFTDFISQKYNLLVCTSVVESGIDMPNVNTIIVDRADLLGLAQLHQLRGRVGRSKIQAYAYLFMPKDLAITETAQKRLKAIEEFSELGSGFKLAERDLEIRGAGNLLGAEQHGHMVSVGYHFYSELLKATVRELKGETVDRQPHEPEFQREIELKISAFLPQEYVPENDRKLQFYRKIQNARTVEKLKSIERKLIENYGDLPEVAENLFRLAELKLVANSAGADKISETDRWIKVLFSDENIKIDPRHLVEQIRKDRRFSLSPPACVKFDRKGLDEKTTLQLLVGFLRQLSS